MDNKFIDLIAKTPNRTSARFLLDYSKELLKNNWGVSNAAGTGTPANDKTELKKFAMIYDLYIKARSYAILNKIFFCLGIILCLFVLIWPSLGFVFTEIDLFKNAIIQTTITGMAALNITIYSHYKKRQLFTENLMRHVVFAEESIDQLVKTIINEMAKIDQGFSFSTLTKKPSETGN